MTSTRSGTAGRDAMLCAVREAREATFGDAVPTPLPATPAGAWTAVAPDECLARFRAAAAAAASAVEDVTRDGLARRVATLVSAQGNDGAAPRVLSMVAGVPGTAAAAHAPHAPHALHDLDAFVCEGVLGVAENGAIWLPASRLGERAALVLARHVIVVLSRAAIVADMHAAYAVLPMGNEPFGLFLAGPSKTADIEQSLVIGAHGATGTTVLLVE